MTVKELIEELKKLPQDADVYRFNESYSYGFNSTEEEVFCIIKEDEYSIIIK